MTPDLVPFPISIIFVAVFGLACIVVLWKLRQRGRIYSFMFRATLVVGIILLAAYLFSIVTNLLG